MIIIQLCIPGDQGAVYPGVAACDHGVRCGLAIGVDSPRYKPTSAFTNSEGISKASLHFSASRSKSKQPKLYKKIRITRLLIL